MAIAGYLTELEYNGTAEGGGAGSVGVLHINKISIDLSRNVIDTTGFTSTAAAHTKFKSNILGLYDAKISLSGMYDTTTGQANMIADYHAGASGVLLINPDGSSGYSYTGNVTNFQMNSTVDGAWEVSYEFNVVSMA